MRTYEEYFDGIEALQTYVIVIEKCVNVIQNRFYLHPKIEVLSNIGELRCNFVLAIEPFYLSETTKSCKLDKKIDTF